MADTLLDTNSLSVTFLEELYEQYLESPDSLEQEWRKYFDELSNGSKQQLREARFHVGPHFQPKGVFGNDLRRGIDGDPGTGDLSLQHRVDLLIRNYRVRGHRRANLDPLANPVKNIPELTPEYYGLTEAHMDMRFSTEFLAGGGAPTLRDIIRSAHNTYCRSIGAQFMHMDDIGVREWLQSRMERSENRLPLSRHEQLRILTRLTDSVIFEEFIQKKYVGAKSFSLEGAETLIPLLDYAIEKAGNQGVEEILIGMPHRGRLNVLANIMGKDPRRIFSEFEDKEPEKHVGRGDVKYHLGYHTDWVCENGKRLNLALAFNPSHLEFVCPVVLGRMRAKNDRDQDPQGQRGLPILIHGDAAFAGEGIVQETLNLSRLRGYQVGGALHVIVNNQIGFTTLPMEGRSSTYASDVAKMLQSPIFHVNGEDPEAVAQVVSLALEFRRQFRRDVFIDMYCFRRRGHNEGDEPAFTQPLMYRKIRERESVRESYLRQLLRLGGVTKREADMISEFRSHHLEQELFVARREPHIQTAEPQQGGPASEYRPNNALRSMWDTFRGGPETLVEDVETRVPKEKLAEILNTLAEFPESFQVHPKLKRLIELRLEMATGDRPLDWAAGEALGIATLALEQVRVRLSGQDAERGTFSHRHSVLHDVENGELYMPFKHLGSEQAPVDIYNSPLSEASVLGFEYGYSVGSPDSLVMWEAQFGDFVNAAQVIIDQFIATAEDKWRRLSGLVLLLPHGLEGTGPEHASARLERFLQLAAEDNMQVVNLTTPAQFFHCLRRQVLRPWRKPLVVMSPKSMLRNPRAVSSLEDLSEGSFQRIIGDSTVDPKKVQRILLCTGKIYYDLLARREALERDDVALVRIEQLYPLNAEMLEVALMDYPREAQAVWVQEEPENMGAWWYLFSRFGCMGIAGHPFTGVFRAASASPATGSAASHKLEQEQVLDAAFG